MSHPRTFLAYGYDLGDAEAGFKINGKPPVWLENDEEDRAHDELLRAGGWKDLAVRGDLGGWKDWAERRMAKEAAEREVGVTLITYFDGANTHYVLAAVQYRADDDGARPITDEELRVQTRWVYNLERAAQLLGVTPTTEPGWVLATYTS